MWKICFESESFKCSCTEVTTKTHIFHIQYTPKSSLLTNNNIPDSYHVHTIDHLTSPEGYVHDTEGYPLNSIHGEFYVLQLAVN